jgi:NAD(P)-dependent dehydrogenase (short-subunit alcohol dehydrogenase family)
MTDKSAPKRIIDEIVARFGRVDILINNAGTIRRTPAVDFSEEDWALVIEVNLSSVFRPVPPATTWWLRLALRSYAETRTGVSVLLKIPEIGWFWLYPQQLD